MKRTIVKLLALALALVLALGVLAGCANHGKTMIKVRNNEISVNLYQLYLSRMKGELALSGENVTADSFWATIVSMDGTTMEEYYNAQVLEGMRQIAAALYLYDELGLSLDRDTKKSIDEWIDVLVEELADGSKAQMNALLAAYGANLTVLRDAAILEAKIEQLKSHLYGEGGSLIAATALEEFYQDTYYRGYQMMISSTYYKHDRDADNRSIYYQKDGVKIAYDTENGVLSEGEVDKNGDPVYRLKKADGEGLGEIAYDKVNGERKYYKDASGNMVLTTYTEEEMTERYETLEAIAEECRGKPELFLEYAEKWSDNPDFNDTYAPNGMYFSTGTYTSDAVFGTFALELAKLEVGELAILESGDGYYLIMRAPLDTGAWQNDANTAWFGSLVTLCTEYLLQQRTKQYLHFVKLDEEIVASASIADVSPNTRY